MLFLIYSLSLILFFLPAWTTRSSGPLPAPDHLTGTCNHHQVSLQTKTLKVALTDFKTSCLQQIFSWRNACVCRGVTACAGLILCSVNHCLTMWLHQPITALPHSATLSLMKWFEGSLCDQTRAAESFCSEVPSRELHKNKIRTYVSVLVWSSAGPPNL